MKPVSPEMLLLLSSRQFFAADLWTFSLPDGDILRYCGGDANLAANGFLYLAGGQVGPYFDRVDNKAKCHWGVGTSADTLVVDCLPGSATILGDPFLDAVRIGTFDGAEVMLERAYMPTYGDTRVGVIRMFVGRVAEIDAGRSICTFSINSHLELFNLQWPFNLAQPMCCNNLGDTPCGVNLASYTKTGTVSASPAPTIGGFSAVLGGSYSTGAFDLGTLAFTSGVLDGITVSVLSAALSGTAATILLNGPLPEPPSSGDTFNIIYGCNKSYTDSNGCPKFSNTARFRGFPWVPQPVVAV